MQTEHTPRKCFRCGYEDHLIYKFPKPSKYNKKRKKQVCFSERGNHALQKEFKNSGNYNDQKIYVSMARMSDNYKSPSGNFGDSSQLTNWILDS